MYHLHALGHHFLLLLHCCICSHMLKILHLGSRNSLPNKHSMLICACMRTSSRLIRIDLHSCRSSALRFILLKSENINHSFLSKQETSDCLFLSTTSGVLQRQSSFTEIRGNFSIYLELNQVPEYPAHIPNKL